MSESSSFLRSILQLLSGLLESLSKLVSPRTTPHPSHEPTPILDNTTEPLQLLSPRVLVVIFNPILDPPTGQRLLQAPETAQWSKVDDLLAGYITDVDECSRGQVKYRVVEQIIRDDFPIKDDQFTYTAASYLQALRTGQYHAPDWANYDLILKDLQLLPRVANNDFDEVWLFGGPGFGFYESRMAGPGAFWCNAPSCPNTEASGKRFVIMGFSYERGVGEMLEDLGHRAESVLQSRWRHVPDHANLWKRFSRYDAIAPGRAEVGMLHWAPNSVRDYDWGNPRQVPSCADDWLNFPNLTGQPKIMNCSAWGNGDIREHHQWWLKRLPKMPGRIQGVANQWWRYVINVADPELDASGV